MGINRDNPDLWKADIAQSVDTYNNWFVNFAPQAFRFTRAATAQKVERAMADMHFFKDISAESLASHPEALQVLRMSTCPPIARDRLVGLAGVSANLVENMENTDNPRLPPKMNPHRLEQELTSIANIFNRMTDRDIFVWLPQKREPEEIEVQRAATIIADRLCGAVTNPIIRNAQEKRQLSVIEATLKNKGYQEAPQGTHYDKMSPGTFMFHTNIPCFVSEGTEETINVSVDVVIMPFSSRFGDFPLLIEAKSAGDFTNVNKRRKEEAAKMQQLRNTFGQKVSYNLFLCGYFDYGYLGYEAAEGIDWIWEHRISDLDKLGI